MKRKVFLLFVLIALFLSGCGSNKVEEAQVGEEVSREEISYKILFARTVSKLKPSTGRMYSYYEAKESGNILLDLVIETENISTNDVSIGDLKGVFKIEDVDYEITAVAEVSNFSELEPYHNIKPRERARVHLFAEIPATIDQETPVIAQIDLNDHNIINSEFNIDKLEPQIDRRKIGDIIKSDDLLKISIDDMGIRNKIEPSDKSGIHSVYKNREISTSEWLVLEVTITNDSTSDFDIDDLVSVMFLVDDKYEYQSSAAIVESNDRKDLGTLYENIKPFESRKAYFKTAIPKELVGKDTKILFSLLGDTYELQFID